MIEVSDCWVVSQHCDGDSEIVGVWLNLTDAILDNVKHDMTLDSADEDGAQSYTSPDGWRLDIERYRLHGNPMIQPGSPVEMLELSIRTTNTLHRHHISTVEILRQQDVGSLARNGINEKQTAEIIEALGEHGLQLQPMPLDTTQASATWVPEIDDDQ